MGFRVWCGFTHCHHLPLAGPCKPLHPLWASVSSFINNDMNNHHHFESYSLPKDDSSFCMYKSLIPITTPKGRHHYPLLQIGKSNQDAKRFKKKKKKHAACKWQRWGLNTGLCHAFSAAVACPSYRRVYRFHKPTYVLKKRALNKIQRHQSY